jgi:phosphohistidine phosphatase
MAVPPGVEILYLVRHGKAGSHPDGDRHRPLSAEGRLRIEGMGPLAFRQGFQADLALSSPYLRAVQTRDLFASVVGPLRSETSKAFTPDADPIDAFDELKVWESSGMKRIAVFTHNPFVTDLAELLLVPGSAPGLVFHTPTILALAFEGGLERHRGRPLWILHP